MSERWMDDTRLRQVNHIKVIIKLQEIITAIITLHLYPSTYIILNKSFTRLFSLKYMQHRSPFLPGFQNDDSFVEIHFNNSKKKELGGCLVELSASFFIASLALTLPCSLPHYPPLSSGPHQPEAMGSIIGSSNSDVGFASRSDFAGSSSSLSAIANPVPNSSSLHPFILSSPTNHEPMATSP